jgi:hypothetical protein
MRILFLLLFCAAIVEGSAQQSDFPKNYIGAFYTNGYYTDYLISGNSNYYGGIDFGSVGITAARRLTKNIYIQSHAFSAGNGNFFFDAGLKVNGLVYHKLQPTAGFSVGSKLGYSNASNLYYTYGLDWHCFATVMLQANVFNDFSVNSQGIRIGATYKF